MDRKQQLVFAVSMIVLGLSSASAITGPDGDFGLVFRNLLSAPPTGALVSVSR